MTVPTDETDDYQCRAGAAPKLTDSEAAALVVLARSGEQLARAALISSHCRIVAKLARRYSVTGLSPNERIGLGELGLLTAIEKFDPSNGFSFATYATWWIRRFILRGYDGREGTSEVREPRTPRPSSGSASVAL